MVNRFIDRWKSKDEQPSIRSKIGSIGKPSATIKEQIKGVIQRLEIQTKMLDAAVQRFENRDAVLFNCVVKAIADRDQARANIFANELGEIRKVEKMLIQESLALESVCMRLNTVSEVGDIVTVLAPAASVLNNVRSGMSGILPEASQELQNIGSLLSDIVTSSNQSSETPVNIGTTMNPEAEQILAEAELAAEKRLRQQFPEVTTGPAISKRASIEA